MFYPMENFTQSPEALYMQKAMQSDDNNETFMYEPMKKLKTANSSDFALLNNQNNLLNQIQINEQIKNKGITSSYNPMFIAGPNHNFDPRFGANQPQEPHKEINQNFFNNRAFGYDPSELSNPYLEQAKMMFQMQSANNASMVREQPMRPVQMSSNNMLRAQQSQLASQINFLQNLEQQFMQSQKVLEQLQAKTFMSNNGNVTNFNLPHFPQERPMMIDQQQSQDFRAMFEQGAQKVFGDFSFLKKSENIPTAANTENPNNEFSELSFDPSLFADNFNFEEGLAVERPKLRPADDLDEKRTAETSACNPDEILFSQMAELLPEAALFSGAAAETMKKASPTKESLLKKRRNDFVENEEAFLFGKSDAASKVKRGRPSLQSKATPDTESSPNYDKPKSGSIQSKVKKDKSSPKVAEYLPVQPQKRERRMNRLQSMRAAWDTYFEEQKKPYTIKLHVDPSDEEYSKLVETRRGEGFQAEVPPLYAQAPRRRVVKTMWDPSAIESSKIQEFYRKLAEIYREEVRNEEAALMILRGTGMDVDSTIELIQNNGDYFKERLFTEPKPAKAQRAL